MVYDSGDFQGVFNKALEISDHANFARRKKESRKRGKLRGIAVGSYLEVTAPPSVELGKILFEDDGSVKLVTGTLDYGQGHATPFSQVLSDQLGVPFDRIKLEQGDSDLVHTGNGTGGSRSITASGMAIVEASKLVIEKGKRAAAHLMEAAEGDIEFANGHFTIAGTDRSIDIMDLARRLRDGKMPEDVPSSLDVDHTSGTCPPPSPTAATSPRSRSIPTPASIEIVRYTGVNDFGTVVNPMLVAGQFHGGVAQGIGQAFMEACQLRRERPADHRLLHGLCVAARRGHSADADRRSSVARQIQSAGHQGLRRSRLRRLALDADQCRARRVVGGRRHPNRHAADA